MIGGLGDMMKQAQRLQESLQDMRQRQEAAEYRGAAGGGMVVVVLNGRGLLRGVEIDPALLTPADRETLQDLLRAAHDDAHRQMQAATEQQTRDALGGLPLPPGFSLPL